jgi:alpha-glucosidase
VAAQQVRVPEGGSQKGIEKSSRSYTLLVRPPWFDLSVSVSFKALISNYAYPPRGEELGLPEVIEIEDNQRQDPSFFRTKGKEVGRDGCRVPLPWAADKKNYGFGPGREPHLPQPSWFGKYAVDQQNNNKDSTLELYRKAINLRSSLQTKESLEWVQSEEDVLIFKRPGGWTVILNFTDKPVVLPEGEVLVSSTPLSDGLLQGESCAWLRTR